MRQDPERIRTLTASTSPCIAAIAESEGMVPLLAAAWTDMTLRQPHGRQTIREVLDRAARTANRRGDRMAASRYHDALREFDRSFEARS
ncbi:hypothetical protein [Rhodospira trueperi]|uniref:Uncharacterized protein n=1 Tax=Rhodospira trueperi TaxID=69960 RepID=A0A1G7EWJ6_9PROT|nr:hypothetical protein [Rhodospira trueperi]SDE68017.1 hypothetical protein SAMN05421720_1109 [Rhodospira trueperi]